MTLPTEKLTTNFGISNAVADYFRRDIRDCSHSVEGNDHLQCMGTQRMGTAVAQWLRCYATNRKVAGSIPGGFIGIFH